MSESNKYYERFSKEPVTIDAFLKIQGDVTYPCRCYLLGKLFEDEAARTGLSRTDTFIRLYPHLGVADSTMGRMAAFRRSVDHLSETVPELIPGIIDGDARLSLENTIILSHWLPEDIRTAIRRLRDPAVEVKAVFARRYGRDAPRKQTDDGERRQSVKDTPAVDAEAQIAGITCTISSWATMIERAFTVTEFADISQNAKFRFLKELTTLKETAQIVLDMVKE